ncbi:hypothetical protein [Actinomadura madurae]|uniref:hypothetical protein n=1 Tax=Actinomadura madurae TaxID=1993 RepID=UPI0020D21B15|nr:hypothetical protein [Actinomadura madurae]MCP9948325.1 hypothetical protein [Actinomadura madurae]MCP9965099.1 hypothetical protein [Actinomadura madurae]MCP9977590.1 hypothetical protein [Actinomadura madurae]MCQ0010912.1 hypothetical protein [Actinomadura madurae]MCQ0013776.1 hypothetical protein [Actinomadura madurae]
MDQQEWRLRVLAGDDTLRQERLTRELHGDLLEVDGIDVGYADPFSSVPRGSKGGLIGELLLWVTVAASSAQTTKVLVTLIREWSSRERHRKIEISYGDASLTISGRPDQAQERLIGEFLDRVDGRDRAQ